MFVRLLPVLAISLTLTACNSGSSSGDGDSQPLLGDNPGGAVTAPDGNPETPGTNDMDDNGKNMDPGVDRGEDGGDGDGDGGNDPTEILDDGMEECSIATLNQWVDDSMRDFYIYADQVPVVDLAQFEDPADLIRSLRVPPDSFSNVADVVTQTQLFEAGMQFGYGSNVRRDENDEWRVFFVLDGSPSDDAGLLRGDVLLEVNGVPFDDLTREQSREFFGVDDEIRSPVFTVRGEDNTIRDLTITKGTYDFVTVQEVRLYQNNTSGAVAGYIAFQAFTETSRAELDQAMQQFIDNPIDDLIVDLRYNGGGRTSIAHKFASQIAGTPVVGQLLETLSFNDTYAANNFSVTFPEEALALDLNRVIFLTGADTASASELLISSLQPYIDVVVIGSGTTVGKPFASRGRNLCDRRLNAMEIISTNANNESVAGGIAPQCAAVDDFQRELGDTQESMLSAALSFLTDGSCDVPDMSADSVMAQARKRSHELGVDGIGMPMETHQKSALSIID